MPIHFGYLDYPTKTGGFGAFLVPEATEGLRMLVEAGVPAFRTPESCADAIGLRVNSNPKTIRVHSAIRFRVLSHVFLWGVLTLRWTFYCT